MFAENLAARAVVRDRERRPLPRGRSLPAAARLGRRGDRRLRSRDSHVIDEVNRGACELVGRHAGPARRPAFDDPAQACRGRRASGHHRSARVRRARGVDGHARVPASPTVGRPRSRSCSSWSTCPGGSRGIVAIARDIRDRIEVQVRLQRLAQAEHARAAELNAVIRAMGEAVVVCAADGTITLTNPAGERLFPDVEERTYAEILDQLNDPEGDAPPLGALGGPVELRTASRSGALDRARDLPGDRRGRPSAERRGDDRRDARRDRGAPARGGARDLHRRPVARAAHAGDHDLRWREAAGARDVDARRGDDARDLPRHPRRGRAAPAPRRGRRRAQPVRRRARRGRAEPVLLQRVIRRVVDSEEGALARRDVRARRRPGAADGHGRPDVRRAGPPQPAVQRRQVRRRRVDRDASPAEAGRRRGHRPRPRRRAGLPGRRDQPPVRALLPLAGHGRFGGRRRDRAVRLCPADGRDGRADLGTRRARAVARSSGSR